MMRTSQSPVQKTISDGSFSLKRLKDLSIHSNNASSEKVVENKNTANELRFNFSGESETSTKIEPFQENDWLLLDCSFGIPLFEGDLNQKVCQRLLDESLCNSVRYV